MVGGWLALAFLFLFFILQFVDLSGQWSVGVVVGGFYRSSGDLGGGGLVL